jgi:hypothetical protein
MQMKLYYFRNRDVFKGPINITDRRAKTNTRTKRLLQNYTILSEKFARSDNKNNVGIRSFHIAFLCSKLNSSFCVASLEVFSCEVIWCL